MIELTKTIKLYLISADEEIEESEGSEGSEEDSELELLQLLGQG